MYRSAEGKIPSVISSPVYSMSWQSGIASDPSWRAFDHSCEIFIPLFRKEAFSLPFSTYRRRDYNISHVCSASCSKTVCQSNATSDFHSSVLDLSKLAAHFGRTACTCSLQAISIYIRLTLDTRIERVFSFQRIDEYALPSG